MRVLITGSSGLIGSALIKDLAAAGHEIIRLVRSRTQVGHDAILWNPESNLPPAFSNQEIDVVIHLAGENIAAHRWTPEHKARIRESRVAGTRLLCEALTRLPHPPKTLVTASAIGYYGDRGDEILREETPPGSGFLAQVCREWEEAAAPAAERGIRTVILRNSMVLSAEGGALARMLPVFRKGLGGPIGTGRQYMSWIALDDVIGAIQHCLTHAELSGPVIMASPNPVRNSEFVETLGKALKRPTLLRMPGFAARLTFGEMADALLLASQRADPARLRASGYPFRFPELRSALEHILTR
ncbi:MAG TPA: TIGR01777 family oxidoreductase [Terriglobia bacterium]|nr:TIGR01777 family oxidoreductase [Terriglobia bacterium]